jgi:hypothetical protein
MTQVRPEELKFSPPVAEMEEAACLRPASDSTRISGGGVWSKSRSFVICITQWPDSTRLKTPDFIEEGDTLGKPAAHPNVSESLRPVTDITSLT